MRMTEQKQEGCRLMHHSRRIPLCADSKSAGPYFAVIKEDFTILYPEQPPKDLYRYELQYYQDTFTEWAEEKRENHIKSRHTRRIQTPRTIYAKWGSTAYPVGSRGKESSIPDDHPQGVDIPG